MPRFLAVVWASLVFAVPACGGGGGSGLYGSVVISPAQPVCRVGIPGTAPAKRMWLEFSARGRLVARTQTDGRGRYRLAIRPGIYAVAAGGQIVGRGLEPARAVVRTGLYRRADFTLDTGIR